MSKSDTRTALDWFNRSQRNEKDVLLKSRSDELAKRLNSIKGSRFTDKFITLSKTYAGYSNEIETLLDLTDEQTLKNLNTLSGTKYTPEDIRKYKVMMEMLYATGARAGDISAVRFKDLNFETGEILLDFTKGKRKRVVPMSDYLRNILEQYANENQIRGSNPLFPAKKDTVTSQSLGKFIKNLAAGTPEIDAKNFGGGMEDVIFGEDYRNATSKTFRKHTATMLSVLEDSFIQLKINPANYLRDELGHEIVQMMANYNQAAIQMRDQKAKGILAGQDFAVTPRMESALSAHFQHAERAFLLNTYYNLYQVDKEGMKIKGKQEAENVKEVRKVKKKKLEVELSEYDKLKARVGKGKVGKAISQNMLEWNMMPAGLDYDQQVDWINRKSLGEVGLPSPVTESDPRLKDIVPDEQRRRVSNMKNQTARGVQLANMNAQDFTVLEEYWKKGSDFKLIKEINIEDAVPQIYENFFDKEVVDIGNYRNSLDDDIFRKVLDQTDNFFLPAEDILKLPTNASSFDNAGDISKFFGPNARATKSLNIKIDPAVMSDVLNMIERKSRMNQVAANLINAAEHTLTPDNFKSSIGRLDYIINELQEGLTNWASKNPDVTPDVGFVHNQFKVEQSDFINELNGIFTDMRSSTGVEYAPIRLEDFDEIIERHPDYFTPLEKGFAKRYTVTAPGAEKSMIRSIQLEPILKALNEVTIDGQPIFDKMAWDSEGFSNSEEILNQPLSDRLEFNLKNIETNPTVALRQKDHGFIIKTNMAQRIFNKYTPNNKIQKVGNEAFSAGVIEFKDSRGELVDTLKPNARYISNEAVENVNNAISRRVKKGILGIVGFGAIAKNVLFPGVGLAADVATEVLLTDPGNVGKDFEGKELYTDLPEFYSGSGREVKSVLDDITGEQVRTVTEQESLNTEPVEDVTFLDTVKEKGKELFRTAVAAGSAMASQNARQDLFTPTVEELNKREAEDTESKRFVKDVSRKEVAEYIPNLEDRVAKQENLTEYRRRANPRAAAVIDQSGRKAKERLDEINKFGATGTDNQMEDLGFTSQQQ